jgi:hypothetical protein
VLWLPQKSGCCSITLSGVATLDPQTGEKKSFLSPCCGPSFIQ